MPACAGIAERMELPRVSLPAAGVRKATAEGLID